MQEKSPFKSRSWMLAFLFIISIAIRLMFITQVKAWDEMVYADLGYDLSKNPFDYSFTHGWEDYVPGGSTIAGFRSPLLPYTLSIFYTLGVGQFAVFLMPLVGALSVIVLFLLLERMFGWEAAGCAALLLAMLPVHAYYSGKMLTDAFSVFFMLLSAYLFWRGFEEGEGRSKVLFGLILGLSVLARYTALWMIPAYAAYLILRDRNLSFIREQGFWMSAAAFFVVLLPWLIYGIAAYGTPLGPFIDAIKASYYTGTNPLWAYIPELAAGFSILAIALPISLVLIARDKKMRKDRGVLLVSLLLLFGLVSAAVLPFKEDRYLLPAALGFVALPALVLVKNRNFVLILGIVLVMAASLWLTYDFRAVHSDRYECFTSANAFIASLPSNAIIVNDAMPYVYYYTKRDSIAYPDHITAASLKDLSMRYLQDNRRPVYFLFTDYEDPNSSASQRTSGILQSNFRLLYSCPQGLPPGYVYGS